MAEGKKAVLLYCDLIHTVEKMDDETAGLFFKHYLRYINDKNPETDNMLIDIAFESVKQNLKRDLIKWDERAQRSRINGALGGRPRKNPTKPSGLNKNPDKPKKPDTVNATVIVNDILLEKETKEVFNYWLDYRKEIKKPIKSQRTLKSLAKKIQSEGAKNSKLVIEQSIQNGWQGLFWDKQQTSKEKNLAPKKEKVNAALLMHKKHGFN